jgi:predicted outer membrane repeat protein
MMKRVLRLAAIITLLAVSLGVYGAPVAQVAQAQVTPVVQPPCDEDAFDTALKIIEEQAGGTITFNCGAAATILFSTPKTIELPVTIDGENRITLSGGNAKQLFVVDSDGEFTLKNIILSNGWVDHSGAAVLSYGTLSVQNAILRNNNTYGVWAGGAIANIGGHLTIENSVLENNGARDGGAIYNDGTFSLTKTTLRGNSSREGHGGAIYTTGELQNVITGSLFVSNRAGNALMFSQGGAIYVAGRRPGSATLSVIDTRFQDNTAFDGGAIRVEGELSRVALINTTFSGNRAASFGGGIDNRGVATVHGALFSNNTAGFGGGMSNFGHLTLQNATLSGNTTTEEGIIVNFDPGIAIIENVTFSDNVDTSSQAATSTLLQQSQQLLKLKNVVLQRGANGFLGGNCSVSSGYAPIISEGFNLSDDDRCTPYFSQAGDKNTTDPLLGPLTDNGGSLLTHLPQHGSPLIDGGQCRPNIPTDQRGVTRPQGVACDIGAVEVRVEDHQKNVFLPLVRR